MVSWMDVNVRKTKALDDFRNSSTLRKLNFSTNTKAQNLFTRKNLFAIHGNRGPHEAIKLTWGGVAPQTPLKYPGGAYAPPDPP